MGNAATPSFACPCVVLRRIAAPVLPVAALLPRRRVHWNAVIDVTDFEVFSPMRKKRRRERSTVVNSASPESVGARGTRDDGVTYLDVPPHLRKWISPKVVGFAGAEAFLRAACLAEEVGTSCAPTVRPMVWTKGHCHLFGLVHSERVEGSPRSGSKTGGRQPLPVSK